MKRIHIKQTLRSKLGTLISQTPTGYRYRAVVNGRQCYFPLGVDQTMALARADDIRAHLQTHTLDEVRAKFHPKYMQKSVAKPYTVGNILKAHEVVSPALGLKTRTAKDYRRGLVRLIQLALGSDKETILKECVGVLTTGLVYRAKSNYLRDNGDSQATKRTFNSVLRNASSMFTKEAVSAYTGYEPSWDLKPMREVVLDADPFKRVKSQWNCPSEGVINNIHWNLENIAGGEMYAILALAFYGGLRCSEISALTTNWMRDTSPSSPDDIKINVLNAHGFVAKGRQGYTIMKRSQWLRIVERKTAFGSCVVRYNSPRTVSRKASQFLREVCDLNVQKPLHELRKICGAHFATKYGLYQAQLYLRHEDPKTTFDHYAGVALSDTCLTLWDN